MVEFLQSYGKVLGFDPAKDVPSLCALQEGLLGVGDSAGEVQDLLVRLLQAALYDPGLPPYCQVSLAPSPSPAHSPSPPGLGGVSACKALAAAGLGQGSPDLGGAALAAASCARSLPLSGSRPPLGRTLPRLPGTPLGSFPLGFLALVFPSVGCWRFFHLWGAGVLPCSVFPPPGVPPVGQEGTPQPHLCSAQSLKILGEKVSEISLNRDTVSEILRCFLTAYGAGEDLCDGLRTKPFQALPPEKKAAILAFLVNELNSSALIIK